MPATFILPRTDFCLPLFYHILLCNAGFIDTIQVKSLRVTAFDGKDNLIGCGRQYDWKRKETEQTGKQNTGLSITQKM
ncbi:amino acid permease [Bacillus velezensis]|nr:amino acid permease [Bacillus velezensis]